MLFSDILIAPSRPFELALTFDDGPNPAWTPQLIDRLASLNVRASFFLIGSRAKAEPALVRRLVSAGHLIGNHSWSHPNLARCSQQQISEELALTNSALEDITGLKVRYFRPPHGAWRPAVLRIGRRLGLRTVLWNAMTGDWNTESADKIASDLTNQIEATRLRGRAANVVLHDGGHLAQGANRGPSVQAASLLASHYQGGRQFVTLDAWEQRLSSWQTAIKAS